jgi:hypothetical protein
MEGDIIDDGKRQLIDRLCIDFQSEGSERRETGERMREGEREKE